MSDVPDAAIEAAASAIVDMLDGDQGRAEWLSELVLSAAAPYIAADAAAQALEDAADEDSVRLTSLVGGVETLFVETTRLRERAKAYRQEAPNER